MDTLEPKVTTNNALKNQWQFWKYLGLLPPQKLRSKLIYFAYALALNSFATIYVASFVVQCFLVDSVEKFCEILYVTITVVFINVKFYNVFVIKDNLSGIHEIFSKLDQRARSVDEVTILRNAVKTAHRCFNLYMILLYLIVIFVQVFVFLSPKRTLMYETWTPIDWRHSTTKFIFVHCFHSTAMLILTFQCGCADTYPAAYMCIISGHIRALSARVRNIGRSSIDSEDKRARLIGCIKDHLVILESIDMVQQILSFSCLAQFFCTGAAQCSIAIFILYSDFHIWKFLNSAGYLQALTSQILFLCYFGQELKTESEYLTEAIYFCNWVDQDETFQKSILLFLLRSQNSPTITAGNIIPVDFTAFVKVMKTTYSFFALINNLKDN